MVRWFEAGFLTLAGGCESHTTDGIRPDRPSPAGERPDRPEPKPDPRTKGIQPDRPKPKSESKSTKVGYDEKPQFGDPPKRVYFGLKPEKSERTIEEQKRILEIIRNTLLETDDREKKRKKK